MEAKPYFDALSLALGLELPPSSLKSLTFQIDGRGLILQWLENPRAFICYAELGSLAGWNEGDICRTLLGANFLLAETEGAALSLNAADNTVGLNYFFPVYGMAGQDFVTLVNNFVELADLWREKLATLNAEQEERARSALSAPAASASEENPDSFLPPIMLRI